MWVQSSLFLGNKARISSDFALSPVPSVLAPCMRPCIPTDHTWQPLLARTLHGTAHPHHIMWDRAISSPVNIINHGRGWVRNTKDTLPVHCPSPSLPRLCFLALHNQCPAAEPVWVPQAPPELRTCRAGAQGRGWLSMLGSGRAATAALTSPRKELWSLQTISHRLRDWCQSVCLKSGCTDSSQQILVFI